MNIISKKNKSKETWVDAEGKVVYIKGVPYKEPRLTYREFREFMTSNTGEVTKYYGNIIDFDEYNIPVYDKKITYYSPFKRDINDFKDDTYEKSLNRAAQEYQVFIKNPFREGREQEKLEKLIKNISSKHQSLPESEIKKDLEGKIYELV